MSSLNKIILVIGLLISSKTHGQILVSTFVDPCTQKVSVFTFQVKGVTLITFMGKSKYFTAQDSQNGTFMAWINQVYFEYSAPCPVNQLTQQITQNTVSSVVASSVSSVVNSSVSVPQPVQPSNAPVSSSSESSQQSTETKSQSNSNSSSDNKSEEKKSDSEPKKESKNQEKKEEKKKENSKSNMTPIIFSSDLSSVSQFNGGFNLSGNFGLSRSSLAGDISYGATAIVFSNLRQFALSTRYSKMDIAPDGLCGVATYSYTLAYNNGSFLHVGAYSYVMMYKSYIGGFNLAGIVTKVPDGESKQMLYSSSITMFAMRNVQLTRKYGIIPELFVMNSPVSYMDKSDMMTANSRLSVVVGNSFNLSISKRFSLSANVKYMMGTMQALGVLIGSRFNL